MSRPARTLAVCGSCATRDNFNSHFNPDHRRWYDIGASNNQSAVVALMSPPVEPEIEEADGLNEHQDWTVRSDLTREFLGDLAEVKPEFLIIDFSGDVRFGVLRLADGRFVTDNPWKIRKTAQCGRLLADGATALHWKTDEDAYRELWVEALARFAAFVTEHCPDTKVIVHRLRSVPTMVSGEHDRPRGLRRWARLEPYHVRRTNRFRNSLDQYAIDTYGWGAIDLRAERWTSHAKHPWGPYWVHYTLDYNRRFLAELHQLDLESRLDPELADRVRVVAAAGRERLVRQARFVARVDDAQRARIRELEGAGVLVALRGALGRRRAARLAAS